VLYYVILLLHKLSSILIDVVGFMRLNLLQFKMDEIFREIKHIVFESKKLFFEDFWSYLIVILLFALPLLCLNMEIWMLLFYLYSSVWIVSK
jgi:hypothetical protein